MKAENPFKEYLTKKYSQEDMSSNEAGPVITISRDFGCFAGIIAENLVNKINKLNEESYQKSRWSVISKEILEKSAEELNTNFDKISHIFDAQKRKALQDLSESFIKNFYVSDRLIIKTIKNIIRTYSIEGNVVIVGRAASIIANDIKRSLHIKLIAPIEYRINQIQKNLNVTNKKAKEMIDDIDNKRKLFNEFFSGSKQEINYYDLIINREKFSEDQIEDIIINLAKEKKLIEV